MIRILRTALVGTSLLAHALLAQAPIWTSYVPFRVFHDTLIVRWPSIAYIGDTAVIAANFFPSDTGRFSRGNRMSIVRSPGGQMRLPDGAFDFFHPQLASDSRGTLHLVWGEPRDSSFVAWIGAPVSLWHSVYRDGRWSTPRQLLSGNFLTWGSNGRQIVCDASGRLHIVLPAALPNRIAIVYIRISPSGDVEEETNWPGGSYGTITSLGRDSLIVAYATSDSATPRGGATLFTRHSGDGGHTWNTPLLVTRSDKRNMSPPVVERSGVDLHLLWIEGIRFGDEQNQIRAFTAGPGLKEWREVPAHVSVAGLPVRLVSAGTKCGDYAVVLEVIESPAANPSMHLLAFRVRDNRLSAASPFPELETAANVAIAPFGDSLRIVFSAVRRDKQPVITATATSRACAAM